MAQIPKAKDIVDLKEFRLISLVNNLYEIVVKVLADRLKKVVGSVVSSSQNAFVQARQILEALLVVNEVIDYWLARNESGILCKLDIKKTYNHLEWDLLLLVLRKWALLKMDKLDKKGV